MKTALLLETLQNQLTTLRTQATPLMGHATVKPRFDRQLFRTRSTLIQDYLAEAQTNLDELRHAVESEQLEQAQWLAEHLTEQITASIVKSPPGRCAPGTVPRLGSENGSASGWRTRSSSVACLR